jgi:glycosyltransferase involved in cell wall biosynthesis
MTATTTGPLKVLHLAAGNLYGGVESQLGSLAECQAAGAAPGLAMEFAVCFEGRLADALRAAGAAVHALGEVRFRRPWTTWRARRRLSRLLADRGADVLIGHGCWAYLLGAPAARRAGRPSAFWMHDILGGGHWVERASARVAPDLIIANSRCTAATLPALFPGREAVLVRYVVPPPVADRAEARAAVRSETVTPAEDVVIVTACRLERWKGQALLLDALALLKDKPGWSAWVVGGVQRPHEQSYFDELNARAQSAGIGDRVRFLGQRGDVPRLLAAADVHCQPNTSPEPFGIAFVEALYAALPVVSTRMGGALEVVDDVCGILVPPDDAPALAAALASLIDDPSARARLGSAGPARAASLCAPKVVLPQLEAVLRGVLGGLAGGRWPVVGGR